MSYAYFCSRIAALEKIFAPFPRHLVLHIILSCGSPRREGESKNALASVDLAGMAGVRAGDCMLHVLVVQTSGGRD